MEVEPAIGTDEFMLDINGMYALIDKEVPSQEGEDGSNHNRDYQNLLRWTKLWI